MTARKANGQGRTTVKKRTLADAGMDEILDGKTSPEEKVPICLRPHLKDERDRLRTEVAAAESVALRKGLKPDESTEVKALRRKLDRVLKQVEESTRVFTIRSIGPKAYDVLMRKHPPTAQQLEEFREGLRRLHVSQNAQLQYDPDAFPPELVAASCVDPPMTVAQARRMWTDPEWSSAEFGLLFKAAQVVNQALK